MQFGFHGPAKIDAIDRVVRAEQLGYDTASFGDSPMIWSDLYATMALAAQATKKIRIGSGISIVGTRMAPAIAAAGATINQIAPGRVFLGLGTGYTAYQLLGQESPIRHAQFAEALRVIQALLRNEEVEFTYNGETRPIKFLMPEFGFINVEQKVPVILAAMGPLGHELAGELADGIEGWGRMPDMNQMMGRVRKGAAKSGRSLDNFEIFGGGNIVILEPGEDLTSENIIEQAASGVLIGLHSIYARAGRDIEKAPPPVKPIWEEYCALVEAWPERTRHYRANVGHGVYVYPEERRFITPELIKAMAIVGRPEELIETIRSWEAAGISHVNISATEAAIDEKLDRFSRLVMRKL